MRLNTTPGRRKSSTTFSKASRWLWLRLPYHQVMGHVVEDPNDKKNHVILNITRGNGVGATIDLTRLTHAELVAFRESVLIATEIAEPLVLAADSEARKAADNGDDSDDRMYRGLPTMVVRSSILQFGSHNQSVLDRHQDVFPRVAGGIIPAKSTEPVGGSVAEVEPGDEEVEGQYDLPS